MGSWCSGARQATYAYYADPASFFFSGHLTWRFFLSLSLCVWRALFRRVSLSYGPPTGQRAYSIFIATTSKRNNRKLGAFFGAAPLVTRRRATITIRFLIKRQARHNNHRTGRYCVIQFVRHGSYASRFSFLVTRDNQTPECQEAPNHKRFNCYSSRSSSAQHFPIAFCFTLAVVVVEGSRDPRGPAKRYRSSSLSVFIYLFIFFFSFFFFDECATVGHSPKPAIHHISRTAAIITLVKRLLCAERGAFPLNGGGERFFFRASYSHVRWLRAEKLERPAFSHTLAKHCTRLG